MLTSSSDYGLISLKAVLTIFTSFYCFKRKPRDFWLLACQLIWFYFNEATCYII